ncbi:SDR family NAD(P)-dependent oxidoreductase [Dactylosporangium sp. CA-092794]|uniref:type I polyketide synthase n=1 Tax=Dactylosporangium sp. CA-092794 TaxID=3239929 RepID=UPI003D8A2AD4
MARSDSTHEIAIIGIGSRFPGACGPAEFWQLLRSGTEAVTTFTSEELAAAGVPAAVAADEHYVPIAGVIERPDLFDASLFGINPKEATLMDPQHRVMLECAWEALEDSGHDPSDIAGRVGVFAGSYKNDYLKLLGPQTGSTQQFLAGVSNDADYLATRISFKLDLTGPSVSVQTACSTALVAVHLAAESLRAGSCDLALAGGVTIRAGQHPGYLYHEGGIYSPDGHCRAFDAAAQGTVIGEGAGLVVLKRLADALADGDPIRAVIKGSAAGNDGADRVGFSAPGVSGQARIVQAALEQSGIAPDTIGYVETHGSGTPLGDRIEIDALTRAYRAAGWTGGTRAIGSVKTNIGHTHAAAGIAGLIKTILVLQHREIPPSLHFTEPNPRIDFDSSPFRVNAALSPWPGNGTAPRAGVSSFGMGGTGVHMVLEAAPDPAVDASAAGPHVLPLSANHPAALDPAGERLADHLAADPEAGLAEVARTLQGGRHAFDHRRVLVAADRADAVDVLRGRAPARLMTLSSTGVPRRIAFLLPGLGEQYEHMGADLHRTDPVFRHALDQCLDILADGAGLDLRPVLFPADRPRRGATGKPDLRAMLGRSAAAPQPSRLDETVYAQPATFAVEYALAQFWFARGVRPDALVGYSLGEYVAATLAGVFSLEDALYLTAQRARMISELPPGAMLAVQLPEERLDDVLDADLSVAAVNGPDLCVIAGPEVAVAALEERLVQRGVAARRLRTTHAFHSTMMEPLVRDFVGVVRGVSRNHPEIAYLSNVTGDWMTEADAVDPAYYGRHLREAVRFGDAVRRLWQQPGRVLVEVGVGRPLGSMAQQARPRGADAGSLVLGSLPGLTDGGSDGSWTAESTAKLWLCGVDIDWDGVSPTRRRVALPTYPFQRRSFWPKPNIGAPAVVEPDAGGVAVAEPEEAGDGRRDLADWFYTPRWEVVPPAAGPTPGGGWLVFADRLGVADELVRELADRGDEVTVVRRGSGFAADPDGSYVVDPANAGDYVELLNRIRSGGELPRRIAHLWLVGPRADDPTDPAAVEEATVAGFTSVLALAQAIGRESLTDPVDVAVISTDLHGVVDGDRPHPAKALVLGPCRVWPLENPSVACRSVDLAFTDAGEDRRALAGRLLDELDRPVAAATGTAVVAIRGGMRLRQEHRPTRLVAPTERTRLRTGGTYLITGGLGGIGLSLAEHLAATVQANLVLVGRSGLPPRDKWPQWTDRPATDPTAERIRAVRRVERAGGTVLVAVADVTDADQLRAVVTAAVDRFGAVHGVVHAAGVPGGGLMQLKDAGRAAAVLAPKVAGALALRHAFAGLPLDFLVHCSSGIAVTGGVGQVDYCAANAFLDALAHHDHHGGQPVVSVNWDAWQGIGMAARSIGGTAVEPPTDRAVRHPFIERRLAGTDERYAIYVSTFDAADSWLVDEHRMLGRAVVPGVGHLELVRAAFADHRGHGDRRDMGVDLSDVTFYTPIVVAEGGRTEVRTVLEHDGDGTGFVVISAHPDPDAGRARWQLHSSGRVAALDDTPARRIDVESLTAVLRDIGRPEHDGPMGFGARSQCLRRMYVGDGEFLARIELPEQFRADLDQLALHPALLDISTAFVGVYHAREFRIPISYGRLRMFAPLAAAVYSHQVYRDRDEVGKETLTSDVTITDLAGNELVRAERFVLKKVHDLDGRLTAAQAAATGKTRLYEHPPVADPGARQPEHTAGFLRTALDHGMSPAEGTDVFDRILAAGPSPQVLVSTRDLVDVLDEVARPRTGATGDGRQGEPDSAQYHPRPELLTPYEAPRDGVEERLAELWQELLGLEKVGVNDHFFELGGHSLLGLQLVPRLREAFAVDLPVGAIFDAPTVATLAGVVRDARA